MSSVDFHPMHLRDAFASPTSIFLTLLALFTIYLTVTVVYNIYFHPLSNYPGPVSYAASCVPYCLLELVGNQPGEFARLHEKYGSVVRIGPDSLSYIGAKAWKDIYGYRPGQHQMPKDMMFYNRTGNDNGASDIIVSNDADHSRYRRTLSNAFSDKALRSSESILNHYFELLIQKLKRRSQDPKTSTVDLTAYYNWTTFDIIGDLAFGEPFHALDSEAYHPYIRTILQGFIAGSYFRVARFFSLDFPTYLLMALMAPLNKNLQAMLAGIHRKYSTEIISKRLSPDHKDTERQDFMYHILRQKDERALSRQEMDKTCSILVIAGSETTATFLSGVTYHLLKNPDVLQKLTSEVRDTFKSEDEITLASTIASAMPYLHATVEEGLRLYPPVPVRLPRRAPPEGTTIAGQFVPGNTSIGVHQWANNTSPLNFHNPNEFVPDRWLAKPPTEYANDELDAVQPFSTGPRNCLGKNLAYGEMRSILARMVWNFDMELDPSSDGWDKQMVRTLWVKPPLKVKLTEIARN